MSHQRSAHCWPRAPEFVLVFAVKLKGSAIADLESGSSGCARWHDQVIQRFCRYIVSVMVNTTIQLMSFCNYTALQAFLTDPSS